ncbi:MAG: 4-alpha-glucanotransferase [Clostridiales bacterium]|jgi:4-alpha-glucanotransferase|nr:4-alpha-glucanotransferase [Clostridiales bacterium]
MAYKRRSGILAHPTSFDSRFGVGDIGPGAYAFVDFLKKAGQSLWQILPLNPTGYGDSPYQSFSTFAGNHLLISPDLLVKEELLSEEDTRGLPERSPYLADYGRAYEVKNRLFKLAFSRFIADPANTGSQSAFARFCAKNRYWLNDYCLFRALKSHFMAERGGADDSENDPLYTEYRLANTHMDKSMIDDCYYGGVWLSWPKPILERRPAAMSEWRERLGEDILYHKFLQFEFARQWKALRRYARENGVRVIGDIPIFVALDSADVWANNSLFLLNKRRQPEAVAGVPPDYFTVTGQLWGNPLYDWGEHARTGYKWWRMRIRKTLEFVDILRIDHFRGFESFWAVPASEKTAVNGRWMKGPGTEFFNAIKKKLGPLPIIAEDLGFITKAVAKMREDAGFPGMKITEFGFSGTAENRSLPHFITDANTVVYTGTHDNDTVIGWYRSVGDRERDHFRRYMNVDGHDPSWDMIRLVFMSSARIAVVPIQDVYSMGSDCRMNTPGVTGGNWRFRFPSWILTDDVAARLRYLSVLSDRNVPAKETEGPPRKRRVRLVGR